MRASIGICSAAGVVLGIYIVIHDILIVLACDTAVHITNHVGGSESLGFVSVISGGGGGLGSSLGNECTDTLVITSALYSIHVSLIPTGCTS